jgi:hypothetical protein
MNSKQRRKAKRKFDAEYPYEFVLSYPKHYRFKGHLLFQYIDDFRKWLDNNNIKYIWTPTRYLTFFISNEKDFIWVNLKWN